MTAVEEEEGALGVFREQAELTRLVVGGQVLAKHSVICSLKLHW